MNLLKESVINTPATMRMTMVPKRKDRTNSGARRTYSSVQHHWVWFWSYFGSFLLLQQNNKNGLAYGFSTTPVKSDTITTATTTQQSSSSPSPLLKLELPGSSSQSSSSPLILEPMLGRNVEYRVPTNNDDKMITQINEQYLDSIISTDDDKDIPKNKRTKFQKDANVHILKASSNLWPTNWSPQEAIAASEANQQIWSTGRHHLYPTTDQPVATLPDGIGPSSLELATNTILPAIAYAFDISPMQRLYFKDCFVAKYSPTGQPGLGKHTDGSTFSFNMLLSEPDAFEGGGTWIEPVGLVKPQQAGEVLIHRGSLLHEGRPVTKGIRYVLVGFVQCDDDDETTTTPTTTIARTSELLLKTVKSFPLGMVLEVDEGDEMKCTTIINVSQEGAAYKAGIRKGDCLRGIMIPSPNNADSNEQQQEEFVKFDGKSFDQVMKILVGRSMMESAGPVPMVIERWTTK